MNQPSTPEEWFNRCAAAMRGTDTMRALWPDMDITDDMLHERAAEMLEEPTYKRLLPDEAAQLQRVSEQ